MSTTRNYTRYSLKFQEPISIQKIPHKCALFRISNLVCILPIFSHSVGIKTD